jgi:excisionase family DNA binding protein
MSDDEDLITTQEAGLILGKSARTVQRMILADELASVRKLPGPNGAYLLRRSDVDALAGAAAQGGAA